MTQLLVFVRKEFLHVFRDWKTMLMLFGLPVAQILLFGFALTNEVKDTRIAVCDYAQDEISHRITEKLATSKEFHLDEQLSSHLQIEDAFKKGKIRMCIVFPARLSHDLAAQGKAQVQIIADASDPNVATAVSNYASRIIMDFQMEISGQSKLPYQIQTETRMVYNPELRGTTNFVPGVMALVLLLVCVLMTSVSIVRERETGTMEILLVSPFNPFVVIVAKALPYLILSLVNLTVILLLSIFMLQMPINGSIVLLAAESILFIITALSLGLMISNITNSQQAAMLISLMGMMLPTMLFTGFMFPIENMPLPLQIISNIVPSKWYYIIVKSVMVKGLGITAVWKETLILASMTTVLLAISIKKFKTRLE